MTATDHRTDMAAGFRVWDQVTEQTLAAYRLLSVMAD